MDALMLSRLQFAFTITYHYLFPQLTMGLALLILILKTQALRTGEERYNRAVRFWLRIFGISFALGVVTGIPMEFQFGTNWAEFSRSAGGVIGQTLAMEGVFSFFLESTFLGLFLFGEKRLGPRGHWFSALMVFLGSWLSGYLIIATDAWMQHPTGYRLGPGVEILLDSYWGLLLNPWVFWQYLHTMIGAVVTGSFVMAAVGAIATRSLFETPPPPSQPVLSAIRAWPLSVSRPSLNTPPPQKKSSALRGSSARYGQSLRFSVAQWSSR